MELDSNVATTSRALATARDPAIADADRGLGARWVALNDYSVATGHAEQPAEQPTAVHAQRQHPDRLAAGAPPLVLTDDRPGELPEPEGPRALPGG